MTFQFSEFNVSITDPVVRVVKVIDNIAEKSCSVDVLLTVDYASFSVTLCGFTYSDTWEDSDIDKWVNDELLKYRV
jgi:hypothetical protein